MPAVDHCSHRGGAKPGAVAGLKCPSRRPATGVWAAPPYAFIQGNRRRRRQRPDRRSRTGGRGRRAGAPGAAGARIVAQALLNAPVELTAAERTELQAVANGEAAAAGKWDKIKKLFEKVPGAARAVRGSYDDFVKWYKALPLKYRAPLMALGIGSDLWSLWQMFQ
ncbi:hypothetical protein ACFYYM_40195 [Streptomyces erythrochromogenes]|uniref:hypothetical protein n=1 Tax=Streptomyces erythrochromogenes TaxID=285574 RepID=UPI00368B59FE